MTYRNVFSLEPSELFVAEHIITKFGCEVFSPIKDKYVDFLAVKNLDKGNREVVTIQVKGSKKHNSKLRYKDQEIQASK